MQSVQKAWEGSTSTYNRNQLKCGIAHLGVGNFVRSHLALFIHTYLEQHAEDWMIHGIGLREADLPLIKAMNQQENLYSLTERSGSYDQLRIIGSIKEFSSALDDPARIIELLASDQIKIISLTITEKGYYYNGSGNLDLHNPEIQADLTNSLPISAIGYLYLAARRRKERQGPPVTLMSCDNVPSNGQLLRRLLLQFAELKDSTVADWIREHISFPNAMVDRITPTVTQATHAFVQNRFEIADQCPVMSEAYLQWVLEDHFANGRPAFEAIQIPIQLETQTIAVSVQLTTNAEPYERLKMGLLNGSHLALAYSAYLMGYRLVHEAMNDPLIRNLVERYIDEIIPAIPVVPGVDATTYKMMLIERYLNPAVGDQVPRLNEDGSKKTLNFIVPPLTTLIESGLPIKHVAFHLAAWYRYLRGIDEQGQPIRIVDPRAEEIHSIAQNHPDDPSQFLAIEPIFGNTLSKNQQLANAVKEWLSLINQQGIRAACTKLLEV